MSSAPLNPRRIHPPHWDFSGSEYIILDNEKFSGSDMDKWWERNGHFLLFEGKREYEALEDGQRRGLERFARLPNVTVILGRGDPETSRVDEFWQLLPEGPIRIEGSFSTYFHRWYREASKS